MPSRIVLTSQDYIPAPAEGRYLSRFCEKRLEGLQEVEALELFKAWNIHPRNKEELQYIQRLIRAYECHPLALRVIAGEIQGKPFEGDISAYWNEHGCQIEAVEHQKSQASTKSLENEIRIERFSIQLRDLVRTRIENTFKRLKKSDPLAYELICMGSAFRCGVERTGWLHLITDSKPESRELAFQSLQQRFLLEEEKAYQKILYRLHNLVRSVALSNLKEHE